MKSLNTIIKNKEEKLSNERKTGRPIQDKPFEQKAYKKITISLSQKEKEKIQEAANQNKYSRGNVSMFIKQLLIDKEII